MARPLRIQYEGAFYHVTARGNEKKDIFRDDQDRNKFIQILESVAKKYRWIIHAYCLMNNHYHLILQTPMKNLSSGMRQLNGVYTQSFNRKHERTGHLFQGRFKSHLIEKESYLLEVCRYKGKKQDLTPSPICLNRFFHSFEDRIHNRYDH